MTEEKKPNPGQWQPGQSGNPAGRPSRDVVKLRAQIAEHMPAVIDTLLADALMGDTKAARLLIERVIAPLKAEAAAVLLPGLEMAQGLVAMSEVIVRAVAAGEIAPDTAGLLLAGLGQHGKLIDIEDLQRRLDALEQGASDENR